MTTATRPDRHTAAEFLARHKKSGLFTDGINQRIAAYMSVAAERLGLPPTALTLGNFVLGLAAAALVVLAAPAMADGRVPAPLVGLVALVLWQVAYSLDCADGQLARVTGQASPAGARLDILCDVALQIALVAAVSSVAYAYHPDGVRPWLVAGFAGSWMVNLVTSALQQGTAAASLVTSRSLVVRMVKLIRDYGAVVTVIGLVLAAVPAWTLWLMLAFTAVNGGFLLVSIAASARTSLRRS
ncbi:CDP-alcohol phosphatidyltransferase family protein [Planosporangium sp. 12N6]|uniref:CDP-alcohol phosphatidyltransferase family protein n=1 Tax=Planosporangium spinosum TaxID=3402278 RepID=UPI003CE6D45B